jgi:hypothetical protein
MRILASIARRAAGTLAGLACGLLLAAAPAAAGPCGPYFNGDIPDCEPQVQAPVQYSGWETQGWAYYCTGDHPYYWGLSYSNFAGNYTWDNSCFSGIQNEFFEDQPNKFDATFTNWCLDTQSIVVTLGCSKQPPPGYGATCSYSGGPVSDPGCAQSNVQNHCSATNPPVCFQTFSETCGDNSKYTCTTDLLVTWCYKCD